MTQAKRRFFQILRYSLPILATVLWIGFIFGNSLQTGTESGNQSKQVQEWINHILQGLGLKNSISESAIRTFAHFSEFAVLTFLFCVDLTAFGLLSAVNLPRRLWVALAAIPCSFLFACIDEFLQTFSDGRAAQFSDIMIDTAGAATGTCGFLFMFIIFRFFSKQKQSSPSSDPRT